MGTPPFGTDPRSPTHPPPPQPFHPQLSRHIVCATTAYLKESLLPPRIQFPRILLLGVNRILQFCVTKQGFHSPEEKGVCIPKAFLGIPNPNCFLLTLWRTTLVYRFHHNGSKPRQKDRSQEEESSKGVSRMTELTNPGITGHIEQGWRTSGW